MPREPAPQNEPAPHGEADPPAPRPADSLAAPLAGTRLPRLQHGLASDPGRRRIANEDAATADPRHGLFVVCDGIGGQPAGQVASHLASRALGRWLLKQVRHRRHLDQRSLKQLLIEIATRLSEEMQQQSAGHPALAGMGCTLVAVLIDARSAFVLHAGDSRAYLLREGELRRLTEDHTRMIPRRLVPGSETQDRGERRMLMEFLGSHKALEPDACVLALQPGDRLLLCTDGLTDPIDDEQIADALRHITKPQAASAALVELANHAGGPDNVTAMVVDYAGSRPLIAADLRPPPRTPERLPDGATLRLHEALLAVEAELAVLASDAAAVTDPDPLAALAAARRGLGEALYHAVLKADKRFHEQPAVAFHRARAHPEGAWLRGHRQRLRALAGPLQEVTTGGVRLSPLLPGDATADLYRHLWRHWQTVERHYLHAFRPGARAPTLDPATAERLCQRMHEAVQTMRELLLLLPRFFRD